MKSEIVLFETKDKEISLSVPVDGETVWLNQSQMTDLFNVDRSVITRHVNNIFKEEELIKKKQCAKNAHCKFRSSGSVLQSRCNYFCWI